MEQTTDNGKRTTSGHPDAVFDVVILGGGTSGLTVAHELANQGLRCCVVESEQGIGGKPIAGTHCVFRPPQRDSSGSFDKLDYVDGMECYFEHAFRVYPYSYQNLLHILKQIPNDINEPMKGTVYNNLINVLETAPLLQSDIPPKNSTKWKQFRSLLESAYFGMALYVPWFLCKERMIDIYDEITIAEVMNIEKRSPELREFLYRLAGSASSGNPRMMSAAAVINLLLNYRHSPKKSFFQTMGLPTNKAWLEPWRRYLENKEHSPFGVQTPVTFITGFKLVNFKFSSLRSRDPVKIEAAEIQSVNSSERKLIYGRKFVSAIPVDAFQEIIRSNLEILRLDPKVGKVFDVHFLPATGIQLYYKKPIPELANQLILGSLTDDPWELTFVDQSSYWTDDKYKKNQANGGQSESNLGIVTVYTAVTNEPGFYTKKSIQKCTPQEMAYEVFMEVEKRVNARRKISPTNPPLGESDRLGFVSHRFVRDSSISKLDIKDGMISNHSGFHLDHDPEWSINNENLHLCVPGMYKNRIKSTDWYFGNLVFAGAWTQCETYFVSTMESAAESGRKAANTVLESWSPHNNNGQPPIAVKTEVPLSKIVKMLRAQDKLLYKLKLPNPLNSIMRKFGHCIDSRDIHSAQSIFRLEISGPHQKESVLDAKMPKI